MRDRDRTQPARLIGLALITWIAATSGVQAQIDAAECDRLKSQSSALVAQGVPKLMEKGPEWAKANLDAAKLASIKQLLDVSEQIMFRCEQLKPINTKVEQVDSEGAESDDTPPAAGAGPKAKAAPVVPVTPKSAPVTPKAAPKPKSAAATQRSGAEPPTPTSADLAPAEPRKPKPKSNDAYAPPAGSGSTLSDQTKQ